MVMMTLTYQRTPTTNIQPWSKGRRRREGGSMLSPCTKSEAGQACFNGCWPNPLLILSEPHHHRNRNTISSSPSNFVSSTTAFVLPNTQFTNHESLPPLSEAFSNFTEAYPRYGETEQADKIRAEEYHHLSIANRVCLDYHGLGLFSYFQQQQASMVATTSHSSVASPSPIFFDISYKSVSLNSQLLYGTDETPLESALRKRIMGFLNLSESDYKMVFTANRTSAFKLLAESYPFQASGRLLTVCDHDCEAMNGIIESSKKRGARVMSAQFSWPSMNINSTKLRKLVVGNQKKRNKRGLFVFPLQSQVTGTRYSCLWMTIAQENGWHVLLDASALGPKDMDALGLSLFRPDFLICSVFKLFDENPSGLGCLFVKKSIISSIEASEMAKSIGTVSILPPRTLSFLHEDSSGSSEPPLLGELATIQSGSLGSSQRRQFEVGETSEAACEIIELDEQEPVSSTQKNECFQIECRGLDHADSMGLLLISRRIRCLVNWLVIALMKLRHPQAENKLPLVRIYGPNIKFDRGPSVAFNIFDWKGNRVEPALVQKLADRHNISLSYSFLQNIWFPDEYQKRKSVEVAAVGDKTKETFGVPVVTAAIGFLANFEDVYRLWAFTAKFLDADFVEKGKWRYMRLNQETIEV